MSLVRKNYALTHSQAQELTHQGYKLVFLALGAGDKDFYDVYL